MPTPPVLLLDLPYYNREQLAAAAGVSLETIKRRIREGDLGYDTTMIGRACFSRAAAVAFCKAERARKVAS